jgi:ABC-type transporter Mla subunit MlaD
VADTPQFDIQKLLGDLMTLVRSIDPVTEGTKLAEQGRRTVEAMILTLENIGATLDNMNQAASRVNRLLDDVEEPIRKLAGMADQAGSIMTILPSLAGKAVSTFVSKPATSNDTTKPD